MIKLILWPIYLVFIVFYLLMYFVSFKRLFMSLFCVCTFFRIILITNIKCKEFSNANPVCSNVWQTCCKIIATVMKNIYTNYLHKELLYVFVNVCNVYCIILFLLHLYSCIMI